MKAIVISGELFLVFTKGVKAQIGNRIVSISTKETQETFTYHGGTNENVPVFNFLSGVDWIDAQKKFETIELKSQPNFLSLYNQVHNAFEDQFESVSDFAYDHGCFPDNNVVKM